MEKLNAGWIGFLQYNDDFWSQVEALAKLGYKGMEGGEFLLKEGNADENIARFYGLGLKILTASANPEKLTNENIGEVIETAKKLKTDRITVWCGQVNSSFWNTAPEYDKVMKELELFERAAEITEKEGITLCYHNHFQEFTEIFNGIKAYNYLFMNTIKLKFELDIAWATYGGAEPSDILRRFKDRIVAIHVKDYRIPAPPEDISKLENIFTGLGTGVVKIQEAIECASEVGIKWVVVEQDKLRNLTAMETLIMSYYHIKESGYILT